MNLLDEIICETERRRFEQRVTLLHSFGPAWEGKAEVEHSRLSKLADRSGPKGALAGHLEELLRHA